MRWMTGLTLTGVAMLAGCLQARSHACPGTDIVCPESLACAPEPLFCATPLEIAACTAKADDADCSTEVTPKGRCSGGACVPCVAEDLRCRYPEWVAMTSPTMQHLRGIWAAGPTDIYAVGDTGTVIHFDGTAWSTVPAGFGTRSLSGIWGASASDLYIVGAGDVFHFTGTQVGSPEVIQATGMAAIWGSASGHVIAVGLRGASTRYSGGVWSALSGLGMSTHLYATWGSSATDFYAGGAAIYRLSDTTWNVVHAVPTTAIVTAMAGTSSGEVFAVGEDVKSTGAGSILVPFAVKLVAGTWTPQTLQLPTAGAGEKFFAVWAAASNMAFAVGTAGLVAQHDGSSWRSTHLGTTLNAITGTSSGDVFAVGDSGVIWRLSYAP